MSTTFVHSIQLHHKMRQRVKSGNVTRSEKAVKAPTSTNMMCTSSGARFHHNIQRLVMFRPPSRLILGEDQDHSFNPIKSHMWSWHGEGDASMALTCMSGELTFHLATHDIRLKIFRIWSAFVNIRSLASLLFVGTLEHCTFVLQLLHLMVYIYDF